MSSQSTETTLICHACGVLIRSSQVFIRTPFMEEIMPVAFWIWAAPPPAPPSSQTPCHPPANPFVSLFHFDFMFAHLAGPRRAE